MSIGLSVEKASTQSRAPRPLSEIRHGRFCFAVGTHVSTLRGEIPVEELRLGDQVKAKNGAYFTVEDVAQYTWSDADPAVRAALSAVTLRRGSLSDGLPRRDLMVTERQEFEAAQKMKISHVVRMSTRSQGSGLASLRFVVFTSPGATAVRIEGLWTTATPCEAAFSRRPEPARATASH